MERQEDRYDDRQARNIGQYKRVIVLRHRTGPGSQRVGLRPAMVAGVAIFPAMEMEGTSCRLFSRICAAHADIPGHEVNDDEQAGHDAQQARRPTGLSRGLQKAERVRHETPYW